MEPEGGDPARLNTFARKLAEDPLFMLPEGTVSPWREREMRRMRESSCNVSAIEDAAFPGVSLGKKHFSVPKAVMKRRADPPTREDELRRACEMLKRSVVLRRDANKSPVAGKGEGKQEKESHEPQMDATGKGKQEIECLNPQVLDPASNTTAMDDLPDSNRATALESVPANVTDTSPPSSNDQPTAAEIIDNAISAATAEVGSVEKFRELVGRYFNDIPVENSAALPEELVEVLEKLGIKSNTPEWKTGKKK